MYGLIQAKLELITHAYFDELDFSKVSLLEETYRNLNFSLTESLLDGGSQVFLGRYDFFFLALFLFNIKNNAKNYFYQFLPGAWNWNKSISRHGGMYKK